MTASVTVLSLLVEELNQGITSAYALNFKTGVDATPPTVASVPASRDELQAEPSVRRFNCGCGQARYCRSTALWGS